MAFAVEDFVTYDSKTDPRYLKWQTVYLEVKDGVTITERAVNTYPCTQSDLERFKKVENRSKTRFRKLREAKSLQCIDWKNEDIRIYGDDSSGTYGALDIMVAPCKMGHLYWADREFTPVERECEIDLDRAYEYLSNLQVVIVFNNGRFIVDEYGDKTIEKYTHIKKVQVDAYRANYIAAFVKMNQVQDMSAYLQYG